MPFTPEQSAEIKKQILQQVEQLPQENKEEIKEYIKQLNEEQLEEFLKQNKMQVSESNQIQQEGKAQSDKPIFQSIIQGEIPSYKIAENNKSIALLEINPLSKGHSIVLPKQQTTTEKIPKSAMTLAQKIAKKIKTKLKPDDIKIETSSFQNYPMINIIPLYKNTPLKKEKADEKELQKLQSKLETKKRSSRAKKPTSSKSLKSLQEIGFRIP